MAIPIAHVKHFTSLVFLKRSAVSARPRYQTLVRSIGGGGFGLCDARVAVAVAAAVVVVAAVVGGEGLP